MIGRRRVEVPPWREAGTSLLTAHRIVVDRGGRRILDGVDISARAGEVLALVGPNGAGKSTLLSALAVDLPVDAGEITVDGRSAVEWSAAELARRRAVLPQHHELAFPFSVEQVVAMGRAPWTGSRAADDDSAVVAESLAACEIEHLTDRAFPTLSGGERARVALARVLAQRAQAVLLDEPTAALDLRHQELVLRRCRDRAAEGCAVVVVVHDLGLAAAHCDRIAIVHDGRIRGVGAPREVLDPQLLTEVYRYPVEVLEHPGRDAILVLPDRDQNRLG